jgi:hypothetical protein
MKSASAGGLCNTPDQSPAPNQRHDLQPISLRQLACGMVSPGDQSQVSLHRHEPRLHRQLFEERGDRCPRRDGTRLAVDEDRELCDGIGHGALVQEESGTRGDYTGASWSEICGSRVTLGITCGW